MLDISWTAQDSDTLAHAARLVVSGKSAETPLRADIVSSPQHAITRREDGIIRRETGLLTSSSALVIAGESILRPTLEGVGYDKSTTDALIARLSARKIPGRINLVYVRIPEAYHTDSGQVIPLPPLDDLRLSALVDAQLEADASLIIPPLPHGLESMKLAQTSLERTEVAMQTFKNKREMVGYVPATNNLELARHLIGSYVKRGVRFFAIDFAGASNQPSLMRSVVGAIRERMRIRSKAKERDEKYYLHAFNVATSRRSSQTIAPISDIIMHPYGVDSTSGRMWGGGNLSVDTIRYYETKDYGAYRREALAGTSLSCDCPICRGRTPSEVFRGTPLAVYYRTRAHRVVAYGNECKRIVERITGDKPDQTYVPYLGTKVEAAADIRNVLSDVREIRAAL